MLTLEQIIRALEAIDELDLAQTDGFYELHSSIAAQLGWTLHDAVECVWKAPDGKMDQPPRYVFSLDAALTLLPPETNWIVGNFDVYVHMGGTPYAQVADITAYGETAVVSLCLAAMLFRQSTIK